VLISGHDPADYAAVLRRLHAEPGLHARLARGAVRHANTFGWDATVDNLLDVYTGAVDIRTPSIPAARRAAEVTA
ncbi:MAG: D-inositol-3-phosphate glycosyltransferase, partial [Spirillospora sp.]